ncbi:hypothetical protein [Lactococcus lactis]|uniref:Uncharacterized protein n=1 Tax=Lactococcus lactis TaxID=1358 RepID=A0AAP8JD57_9LACT|nr:hypothetical protein [Lactococcus lactis]MDG4972306.1 hypothetical protein [Lactococcus lactis]PFG88454.1 hypothetical protein BW154_02875 [Lactococcus lactis]
MKLSEIEEVAYTHELRDFIYGSIDEKLYNAEQMQQFMVQNVRHALTLYGAKVCGFHLEQLEKSEIEKIIQDLFTEDTKNESR